MTGVTPSGSGHSAEPEPSFTVSAVPVSVPNAEEADRLGSILSHLDDHWATDTTRAVAVVIEWEMMKERSHAAQ